MTSSTTRYVTTEYGKQNMFAREPRMQYDESYQGYWKNAELTNGNGKILTFGSSFAPSYIMYVENCIPKGPRYRFIKKLGFCI